VGVSWLVRTRVGAGGAASTGAEVETPDRL